MGGRPTTLHAYITAQWFEILLLLLEKKRKKKDMQQWDFIWFNAISYQFQGSIGYNQFLMPIMLAFSNKTNISSVSFPSDSKLL